MKAKHLRIGNLVFGKYEDDNEVEQSVLCRVIALDETGEMLDYKIWVETFGSSNQEYFDGFEPIPLTEEWLIGFGFEKDIDIPFGDFEYVKSVREGNMENEIDAITIRISPKFEFYNGIYSQIVPSVHQLQNLYHALTGEELIIK